MKKLVAYFSATGVTKGLAKNLARVTGADLFEIVPERPYSNVDLDWTNERSRSSVEMKNLDYRPEMKESFLNIDEYDVVFVGFPIWWYIAPTIINTFLEAYDFSEKLIVPFATSGGSGMGETNEHLAASCPGATIAEGKKFSADVSDKELFEWAKEFV